jgi:hypothetical protein
MYDRTILREAAKTAPKKLRAANANQLAAVLAGYGVGRMTAYRLWNGDAEPSRETASIACRLYRVSEAALLIELEPAA